MGYRLLFDEMTEARLAGYCSKRGHDAERVISVPSLGSGADDREIVAYAERESRLLVTYDEDFLSKYDALARVGVLYRPDDRLPPMTTANVIDAIAVEIDQEQLAVRADPLFLTTDWL